MKPGQNLWSREELILAVNLYSRLPFGQLHKGNTEVRKLAELIERTPGSVAMKLGNLASLDPVHQARGIKGLGNASKLDCEVWDNFFANTESITYEAEVLKAKLMKQPLETLVDLSDLPFMPPGEDKERLLKTRVNQKFFRDAVMSAHNNKCCITGLSDTRLLVASHIIPWKEDKVNRLNPANGLALNSLHDAAFDRGLITLDEGMKVVISSELKKHDEPAIKQHFLAHEGQRIREPNKFAPNVKFLKYHYDKIFRQ